MLILSTDSTTQLMLVSLLLNFPAEKLEVVLNRFGVNAEHGEYTRAIAACAYRFLIDYFCNGCLQIFDAATGQRLSYKTAFVPVNIDLRATVEAWKQKIRELEAG